MGKEPLCLLTDQCPAMKHAVPAVFSTTRHRWCMWHIMNKFPTKVKYFLESNKLECTCKLYERIGILCSHAFFTLKMHNVTKISRHHVLNCWTKNAEHRVSSSALESVSSDVDKLQSFGVKVIELWFEFNSVIGLIGKDSKDMDYVVNALKDLKHELRERRGTSVVPNKKSIIENLIGIEIPDEIIIKPPTEARNKGCGRKRILSSVEKSMNQKGRTKRLCGYCNKMRTHDKRNCPAKDDNDNPSD